MAEGRHSQLLEITLVKLGQHIHIDGIGLKYLFVFAEFEVLQPLLNVGHCLDASNSLSSIQNV